MAKIKGTIDDFIPDPHLVDERGPTKERLHLVGDDHEVGNETGAYTVRDAPIERMVSRKIITERQYDGLGKYRLHWFNGGLGYGYGGVDPNHIFATDISNFSGMAKTERQVFHRQQWRAANHIMGLRGTWVVGKIVCEEVSVEEAGKLMGWNNKPQARAVATQLLRDAADKLCELWGK